MARFTGKTVVVTGAGSGIGRATAERFGQEGANVVIAGRREAKLREVAGGMEAARVLAQVADVSRQADVEALVAAAVEKFGGLDVLVNNAGTATMSAFTKGDLADWRRIMAINVDGVVFGCRAAIPHLLQSRGSIINVSSVSGLGGDWGMSFYNASKGAVSNLTRALALEYGGQGIRVNAVNPSMTSTELTAGMQGPEIMKKLAERLPLGRAAEAAELAAVIAFLASEDASFVNGVNLPVDGGISASNGQPNFG